MRWLKTAGWLALCGLLGASFFGWLPDPINLPAGRKARQERLAKLEGLRAERDKAMAQVRLDGTLNKLKVVWRAYSRHTAATREPPTEDDFRQLIPVLKSSRDEQPYVILWGVDLTKLPASGSGHLLAWESTPDVDHKRCVLMADGTALLISQEEFDKLPRAK